MAASCAWLAGHVLTSTIKLYIYIKDMITTFFMLVVAGLPPNAS